MFFAESPAPPLPRVAESWRLSGDKTGPGIKGEVVNPSDVAFMDDDYFVVADSEGHGLPMYDVNGRALSVVAEGKVWPNCVAATRDGKIVCTDRQTKRTKIFDVTGTCVRELGQDLWDGEFEVNEYMYKLKNVALINTSLRWRHNGYDGVSDHQPHNCLLNRLFGCRSKKTSKLRVTGLCAGNSPETGEFPAQMVSNAENGSIWWRHHVLVNSLFRLNTFILFFIKRHGGTYIFPLWKSHGTSILIL